MTLLLAKQRAALLSLVATAAACSVYERGMIGDRLATGGGGSGAGGGSASGSNAGGTQRAGSSGAATDTAGTSDGGANDSSGHPGPAAEAGTDSSGAGAPSAMSTAGDGAGGVPNQPRVLELLDDMEDGDAFVLPSKGRNGHWDVSHDATVGATQTPLAAHFTMTELADATRPDSLFAAYTQGAGFKDWGAFMTVSMRTWPDYEQTPVYDASAYVGVSFYAKVGAGSDTTLRVRYVGGQTDPRGKQCTPGGTLETSCYDHFFAQVKLDETWQRVDLFFSDFQQAGVGKSFPALDLTSMYALEFFFPGRKTTAGDAFELWVDDLSFIVQ